MKLFRSYTFLALLVVLTLLVSACQPAAPAPAGGGSAAPAATPAAATEASAPATGGAEGVIKVYTSWPLQGSMLPIGDSMKKAVDLALEHYLADHNGTGPAGFTIQVLNLDDASPTTGSWDGTIEAENAQKCVNDPDCMIYFGTYNSGAAKISMPITNRAGIAHITPANTYPA